MNVKYNEINEQLRVKFGEIDANLRKVREEAMRKLEEPAREGVKELLKEFFTSFPTIKAIAWIQEENHYNDETYEDRVERPSVCFETTDWSKVSTSTFWGEDDGLNLQHDFFQSARDLREEYTWDPQTCARVPRTVTAEQKAISTALYYLHDSMDFDILKLAFGGNTFVLATPEEFYVTHR